MTTMVFILNLLLFIAPGSNSDNCYQPAAAIAGLPDDEQKKVFTEAFMKYVNSSFYTDDFMKAFSDLRDGKAIVDKDYPQLVQYKTSLDIPGKTSDGMNYILTDKVANVPFQSKHKEASAAKLDYETNVAWVREALGPSYKEREINYDTNPDNPAHFLYFYRAGVDIALKHAFHVEVNYMYSKSKKGSSGIVIYGQRKN